MGLIVRVLIIYLLVSLNSASAQQKEIDSSKFHSKDSPTISKDTVHKIKPDSHSKLSTDLQAIVSSRKQSQTETSRALINQMSSLNQFKPVGSSLKTASDKKLVLTDEAVYVYVYFKEKTDMDTVKPYILKYEGIDQEQKYIAAWIYVSNLETIAGMNGIKMIRTVLPPVVRTGSVTSEGDIIHHSADLRSTLSFGDGSGIKIGIISDGVDSIASAQLSGDIPQNVTVLSNTRGGDEGTAMLEIVYDLAPGAELYFHDSGSNTIAFNSAITALVNAGCNIICDDIGWITEPFFEDGVVATHIKNELSAHDILYVSSAGNAGNTHYQGDFTPDATEPDWHNFGQNIEGAPDSLYVHLASGESVIVILQWDDQFGDSGNDYDLYLYSFSSGAIAAASWLSQLGSGYDPLEYFVYTATSATAGDFAIWVNKFSGTAKTLELYIYDSAYTDNLVKADSIFGHPAVPGVVAVGAIRASDPGNDDIEFFSSQGPTSIRWPSAQTRNKPDIIGIDGNLISGAGGFGAFDGVNWRFYGTSAAAPHIAAVAAQIWGMHPLKNRDDIKNMLLDSASDRGTAGFDTVFGYGLADTYNAYSSFGTSLPGDVDGNEVLELKDVIVAAKIITDQPAGSISLGGDVDGDNRLGNAELIYILRALSDQ